MKCPKCGNIESKVIDSRSTDDFSSIRRRRECLECKHRFTTYEIIEHIPLIVIKKDGTREEFSREKLMNGIIKSCQKRPISMGTIEKMVSDIEKEALDKPVNEISSDALGEAVMDKLKDIDDVAYVRFASVYRQFKDINTFMDEMKSLLEKKDME